MSQGEHDLLTYEADPYKNIRLYGRFGLLVFIEHMVKKVPTKIEEGEKLLEMIQMVRHRPPSFSWASIALELYNHTVER